MLKNLIFGKFITFISCQNFIELGANRVTCKLSKEKPKILYKNNPVVNQRKRIMKIGKR